MAAIRDLLSAGYGFGQYEPVLPSEVWRNYLEDILDLDSWARIVSSKAPGVDSAGGRSCRG